MRDSNSESVGRVASFQEQACRERAPGRALSVLSACDIVFRITSCSQRVSSASLSVIARCGCADLGGTKKGGGEAIGAVSSRLKHVSGRQTAAPCRFCLLLVRRHLVSPQLTRFAAPLNKNSPAHTAEAGARPTPYPCYPYLAAAQAAASSTGSTTVVQVPDGPFGPALRVSLRSIRASSRWAVSNASSCSNGLAS